jgi:hypothetical protein
VARSPEDPLVAQLFDGKHDHAKIARAIEQLTPEEAAYFLHKLEAAYRKRKIQLSGYLVAMVAWLVGMTMALVYFGMSDLSSAWAFLVPFGIVGVILYVFGAWAERVGRAPPPQSPPPSVPPPGSSTAP